MIRFLTGVIILFGLVCEFPTLIRAQERPTIPENEGFQSGARVAILRNFQQSTGQIVAGCPECGTYNGGAGFGYDAEVFGEMPARFLPQLSFAISLGIAQLGGDFGNVTTRELRVLDPNSGLFVPLVREHAFSSGLLYADLMAGLKYQPLTEYPAYLQEGLMIGFPMGGAAHYTESETILSPDGVVYPETGTATRIDGSGEIQNISTSYALRTTLGYRFPVKPSFDLAPEISFSYPLNNVEPQFSWQVSSLAIGVALRWHPVHEVPDTTQRPKQPPLATKPPEKPAPPTIALVATNARPVRLVETIVTETFPLLPYIFFDSAKTQMPERFVTLTPDATPTFNESNLPRQSLTNYYNLLNIVGERMRRDTTSNLRINGTTDGRELPTNALRKLAEERAQMVKQYLVSVWGIDASRFKLTTSGLPANPSSTKYPQGYAENRRVELSSNDDALLGPVVHERFKEESAEPQTIPVTVQASGIPIAAWQLSMAADQTPFFTTSGSSSIPPSIACNLANVDLEKIASKLAGHDSITATLTARATNGTIAASTITIPASKQINPFELNRLSLIVFDFDQSNIDAQNERMISKFVSSSIFPSSKVSIVGSTDNLGELDHNQKLSQDRATNVRDIIVKEQPSATIMRVEGIGPAKLNYDNELPEGRYYCRTVKVEVETPLQDVLPK